MRQIPIEAVPNQTFFTEVNGQNVKITIRTLGEKTLFSVESDVFGSLCDCITCVDRSAIVRAAYTGFVGDFIFADLDGESSPQWQGFNKRWILFYIETGFND